MQGGMGHQERIAARVRLIEVQIEGFKVIQPTGCREGWGHQGRIAARVGLIEVQIEGFKVSKLAALSLYLAVTKG